METSAYLLTILCLWSSTCRQSPCIEPWCWAPHRLGQKRSESAVLLSKRLTCPSGSRAIETAVLPGDRDFHVWASLSLTCCPVSYLLDPIAQSPAPATKSQRAWRWVQLSDPRGFLPHIAQAKLGGRHQSPTKAPRWDSLLMILFQSEGSDFPPPHYFPASMSASRCCFPFY